MVMVGDRGDCAASDFRKLLHPEQALPIHRSLKRKRGVGSSTNLADLTACVCFKPLHPHISLHTNPSLALQASCALERGEELGNYLVKFHPNFTLVGLDFN